MEDESRDQGLEGGSESGAMPPAVRARRGRMWARRLPLRFLLLVPLLVVTTMGRPARAETIALDLVLAVDVSGSVSMERFALQRHGYAQAFRDARVVRAITMAGGTVVVTMTQWTGPHMQVQVVPWTRVSDAAGAHGLADAIVAAPRQLFSGGTSISGAIDHAVQLLNESPHKGMRRVIDVSGDGTNNRGRSAAEARDDAVAAGIIVNGLPILALDPTLDRYYRDHVVGGPGAFVIAAETYESFSEAIVRKLVLEIAGPAARPSRHARPPVGKGRPQVAGHGESNQPAVEPAPIVMRATRAGGIANGFAACGGRTRADTTTGIAP